MLKLKTADIERAAPAQAEDVLPFTLDFAYYWTVIRREWPLIAAVAAAAVGLGLVYVLTAQPLFTASGSIMIDVRKNQVMQNQQVIGDMQMDASGIESQVELIKSESVALAVIRELKLLDDPVFNSGGSLLRRVLSAFSSDEGVASDSERERLAVTAFVQSLKAKRAGLTYVIDIEFTSPSAERSAEIVNAIADAYMVNELDARYQATKRASRWLQDRIKELREQANVAEQRVQEFRAKNGIVDTGRGLLSEQQLSDVNTQLAMARALTAETKAKLDRITDVARGDVPDATVTDALRNEVITRLRAQYLDISARFSDWSARYGANHTATVNLRNQMQEIRRSILDELRRIGETYKSDYEIARAREQSLQDSLAGLVSQAGVTGQAQVQLRDLESSAQTARNLYDSFLQRFMEATQQQTFPISEARLITAATPPLFKSAPRTKLIVPAAGLLGLMLGIAAALIRERLDNVFRTVRDVETFTGAECLGILPKVDPAPAETPALRDVSAGVRSISRQKTVTRHVLDAPFSRFTETLRSVKVAADIRGLTNETRIIGVVSAVPNEGKTTISANFATLLAQTGNKVLLIDSDLRNPSLTKTLAPDAEAGLVEVITRAKSLSEVICTEAATGLHFLPAVLKGRISHTAELISSRAMAALLEGAREHYNYVIVDLPPIAPVVDVRAVAHLIDGFVCVTEWGKTSRDVVGEAFTSVDLLQERLIGVVLNKANPGALKRIESYKGRYYGKYYQDYGAAA
ncbi:polysaccharide biosynthesis tyrosine autokinase [Salinarimonas soli]|uniref:non-specific protein-tyrosine kinase n=1 Tax=Salinarimonas soli TaxID=1638099 RepID=A0A5B2VD57_9HYPH|nr:polysaccharide biosynthesis tyrosine autokinase [Salinarimonas soli]KAA2236914.1 polysaccharide biosynthesis tyrosine autokinase [Salinarimonas soli]